MRRRGVRILQGCVPCSRNLCVAKHPPQKKEKEKERAIFRRSAIDVRSIASWWRKNQCLCWRSKGLCIFFVVRAAGMLQYVEFFVVEVRPNKSIDVQSELSQVIDLSCYHALELGSLRMGLGRGRCRVERCSLPVLIFNARVIYFCASAYGISRCSISNMG